MDNGYSRLYSVYPSDGNSDNITGAETRRSTTKPSDSRRFMPNGNLFSRETAAELHAMPLDLRLARVYQLFHRSDMRDIQEIFQPAVEAIFGFRSPIDNPRSVYGSQPVGQQNLTYIPVSFCDITTDYQIVFDAGFRLLNTDGPVMKFLTAVTSGRSGNISPKLEFPVSCLPYAVQHSMENGVIPPFYRDKVASPMGDYDPPETISLSAFDFFFAHFAYHIVNPEIRTSNPAHPSCLYMVLIDNYANVFFDASAIVENQRLYSSQSSSAFSRRSQNLLFSGARALFEEKQNGQILDQKPQPNALATPENLESLISILVEFWLNLSGFSSQRYGRRYHSSLGPASDRGRLSPIHGQSPLYSPSAKRRLSATLNVPTVFPPVCAMQAVRQIVKAIHQFIYAPAVNPRNQKNHETSLLDMKRHVVPQLIQKPLYDLLKTTMKKYPMDASFRFVYELWLTYIQPWRYESERTMENSSVQVLSISKEQRWNNFITENLLFYGTVFQTFIDRMLRVDFGVPFNTMALFRVAKVFREADMYQMVLNAELSTQKSPTHSSLSPSKTTVRNHFADLEGDSSFRYLSFDSPDCLAKVTVLLTTLVTEQKRCQRKRFEQLNPSVAVTHRRPDNWKHWILNSVKSVCGLLSGPIDGMQLRPEELEKMSKHLSDAVDYLCHMFQIEESDISESERTTRLMSQPNEFLLDQEPSFSTTDASFHAIARSRSQIRPKHSIPTWLDEVKVPYLTEPEKRLPRSWEIEFLIPLLNALSDKINLDYGDQIIDLYNGRDFVSRLVRPLIQPPHFPPVVRGASIARPSLPARINLRPLASKYFLGSVVFFWIFIWMFDFGMIRGIFWMLALPAFFLLANALLEPLRDTHDDDHN